MFNTEYFLIYTGLFWQYPAITEKTFYEQNKHDEKYVGIPWATIIDKGINLQNIFKLVKASLSSQNYYTCCQHIYFKKLIPLFKGLNITKVYVSHKEQGVDMIQDICLLPCPIYALNIEDNKFNKEIKEAKDVLMSSRDILFSFVGGYHPTIYMSDIRKKIYELEKRDNVVIENTGDWHLNKLVYNPSQNSKLTLNINDQHMNQTRDYNKLLLKSRYTLAPSGSGPNSIRFWEALGAGSIPVLLADTLELPKHKLWDETIVRIAEKDVYRVYEILEEISEEEENRRRKNCLTIYKFFKDNYKGVKPVHSKKCFKINIPIQLINPYFKVFGHFFGDHLFQLYKIKKWYEETYDTEIENIIIENYEILLQKAPFVDIFYKCLFKHINQRKNCDIINLNVILGSVINSETNKLYYLSHTSTLSNIPSHILDNFRKPNEYNKKKGIELRDLILDKLNITTEDKLDNEILIINRKNSRKLLQTEDLYTQLSHNNYKYNIVYLEDYDLAEQIKLVRSYKNVITACGSVQVHISFMKENSKWIELGESGFRYPNTSIYGNRYNINTYMLCCPLVEDLVYLQNNNIKTKQLFELNKIYPNIITNTLSDIEREIIWYTLLLSPECISCWSKIRTQDINCKNYIDDIIDIIKTPL